MHVESVAWIAERKDVLYTLFYLLGLIAYVLAPGADPRVGGCFLQRSFSWWRLGNRARALADAREALTRWAPVDSAYLRELGG
jgi:hypothetical protein